MCRVVDAARGGSQLERALYAEEFPFKENVVQAGWHLTVPQNRLERDGRQSMLVTLEKTFDPEETFLEQIEPHLIALKAQREFILCGDVNIAHTQNDLKNWRGNRKNSGFLPHERAWLDRVLGETGWVDAYRRLHPDAGGPSYTWWSNRGQAWGRNVGWRIDYQIVSASLRDRIRRAGIYKGKRFSDHAPLTMDYA